MSSKVPLSRVDVDDSAVRVGRGVRSRTWSPIASVHNWALGFGAQVVPAYAPLVEIQPGESHTYKYYFRPRYQAVDRLWFVSALSLSSSDFTRLSLKGGSATAQVRDVGGVGPSNITHRQPLSAQSESGASESFIISCAGSHATAFINSIACVDIPRYDLSTSTSDLGLDDALTIGGAPILDTDGWDRAIDVAQDDPGTIGRRLSLLQWAVPALEGGATPSPANKFASAITATSNIDFFSAGIPVLTRKDKTTDTTGTITARFHAWVTAGTADLALSSSVNGLATAVTISNTAPAWSNAVTLSVDCEDVDSADGRQTAASPAWDLLQARVHKNTSGTLYIASVSVWED